jgi:sulfoxide reductase heme-binding subunit YedZ
MNVWLASRAAGLVAEVLLGLSVAMGIAIRARPFGRRVAGASVAEAHRVMALVALAALTLHGLALWLDRAVEIPLAALLVPGLSPYRPVAVGVGVAAAWCMLIVVATSTTLRRRLTAPVWRAAHLLAYPAFLLGAAHGIAAGTDARVPWVLGLHAGLIGVVVAATVFRVAADRPGQRAKRAQEGRVPATRVRPQESRV